MQNSKTLMKTLVYCTFYLYFAYGSILLFVLIRGIDPMIVTQISYLVSTARFWNKFHQVHSDLLISHIKNESFICSRETNRVVYYYTNIYTNSGSMKRQECRFAYIFVVNGRRGRVEVSSIYIILRIIAHRLQGTSRVQGTSAGCVRYIYHVQNIVSEKKM